MGTKGRLAALLAVLICAVGGVVAIAAAHEADDFSVVPEEPIAEPSPNNPGGVPEGPEVNFCPTHEQTEAHLDRYGFDYKPTVPCTRDGELEEVEPAPSDPYAGETNSEIVQEQNQDLRQAEPVPPTDNDPSTIEGETPNGNDVTIELLVPPEEEMNIDEFAEEVTGSDGSN
ncbi:hypothetical protein HJD18_14160 [Thermoleophilia bacterium SCSIO 60948]|nr:hypothetical protein HJD18_14160 [Thermoleophilia bacterium SCSIO 60948]